MYTNATPKFVSRGGLKLEKGIQEFKVNVQDTVCIDLGSSTGGFVDCLLQHGAKKVYAVEKGYGILDWKLRKDPRVIVMERTNALEVRIPEKADIITIDSGWTKQATILPKTIELLKPYGMILSLVKPNYEAGISYPHVDKVVDKVQKEIVDKFGDKLKILGITESPILGTKGKNKEFIFYIQKVV